MNQALNRQQSEADAYKQRVHVFLFSGSIGPRQGECDPAHGTGFGTWLGMIASGGAGRSLAQNCTKGSSNGTGGT